MRIAILGTRGIPANYGGFETFAEHLSTRLWLVVTTSLFIVEPIMSVLANSNIRE